MEEYTVEPGDSLIGISLKLNITLYSLLRMNSLSEESVILPGMKIKLHNSEKVESSKKQLEKEVIYCTSEGDVSGKLIIDSESLNFIPLSCNNRCDVKQFNRTHKSEAYIFNLTIDLSDISDVKILENCDLKPRERIVILQITVFNVGEGERSEEPKASVYFKIKSQYSDFSQKTKDMQCSSEEIISYINLKRQNLIKKPNSTTSIPFYELLTSYLQSSTQSFQSIIIDPQSSLAFSSTLTSVSSTLTDSKLLQIEAVLPDVYKQRAWSLLYSTDVHGSSIHTFFRMTEERGPSLLVIKDNNQAVFGAFVSVSWKISKMFYGNGEIFLFRFEKNDKIKQFYPNLKDECYLCSDFEGIVFGAGEGAALFVGPDVDKGYSWKSKTYRNCVLSGQRNFDIVSLEVWGFL